MFIIVGLTAIQASNYVPFIPEHKVTENGDFGGWQGIYAGVSMIFLAYIGFDSIAANLQKLSTHKNNASWYSWFIVSTTIQKPLLQLAHISQTFLLMVQDTLQLYLHLVLIHPSIFIREWNMIKSIQ